MALFISEDTYKGTLGNTQSQNLYTYVHNNPLIYTDPSGHNGLGGPGWKDELNRELGIEPIDDFEASMGIINFLILDDLSTIVNPNSSAFEKALAGASITPVGKIVKIGGKLFKIVSKGSDEAGYFAKGAGKVKFGSIEKLEQHFAKHGGEFKGIYNNADEYLQGARDVMQNGTKVSYVYKGETRTGFLRFMGNNSKGVAKFEFVGTNNAGQITTYHVESGKTFWKMLNGENIKVINPLD